MPPLPGTRKRDNGVFGVLTDNPLAAGSTTINSNELTLLAQISSDHAIITLDPIREFGNPEIIVVTAHTVASTSATVNRGQYGTTARNHPQGTSWVHAPVDEDFIEIVTSGTRPTSPYKGQIVYETDTGRYTARNETNAKWEEMWPGTRALRAGLSANIVGYVSGTDIPWSSAEILEDSATWNAGSPTIYQVQTEGIYHVYSRLRLQSAEIDNTFTNSIQLVGYGTYGGNIFASETYLERGGIIVGDTYVLQVQSIITLVPGDSVAVEISHSNGQNPTIVGDTVGPGDPFAFSVFEVYRIAPIP